MTHSFLMIGQSNMAGRGFIKDVPQIFNEHIKMQRNGLWQIMSEPINFDRPSSGVGLAASFAASWRLDNIQDDIGLIPCAEGGSSLNDWSIDGALFENALCQTRLAQRTSELKGILWHQGENDCSPDNAKSYCEKLDIIINSLRKELDIPEVPLIIGGLGDYLAEGMFGQYFSGFPFVNQALKQFSEKHSNCYFVTAKGLSANPDGIHFNALSLRRFGLRYYHAYNNRKDVLKPLTEEDNLLNAIYTRPHTQTEKIKLLEHEFAIGNININAFTEQLEALRSGRI